MKKRMLKEKGDYRSTEENSARDLHQSCRSYSDSVWQILSIFLL